MPVTLNCEVCGDTFEVIDSRADSATYCSRECYFNDEAGGAERRRVSVTCETCGDQFEVVPSREDTARYCSRECQHGKTLTLTCGHCGEAFTVSPSRSDTKYCCRECADIAGRRQLEKECEHCGESFTVHECNRSQRFCSFECRGKVIRGEIHPTYDGGRNRIYYGPSWERQRRSAVERDGRECAICGLDEDAHRELAGGGLHVHHKMPFRVYGLERHEEANRLGNLITVCRSCHHGLEPVSQARAETAEVAD